MESIFSELNEISKNKKKTVPALIADALCRQFCPFVYNDELYTYNGGVYNRHIINIGDATNAPILTDFIYAYNTEL